MLVNNAGFTVFGKFSETPLEEELNMMQLNMTAVVTLTKLYLKGMVAANSGRILNVGIDGRFSAGTADGYLLRHEIVCALIPPSCRERIERHGCQITTLPRADRYRISGTRKNGRFGVG